MASPLRYRTRGDPSVCFSFAAVHKDLLGHGRSSGGSFPSLCSGFDSAAEFRAYLVAHKSMSHDPLAFKAVLLGDSGVGKTSLITRWCHRSYQTDTNLTIGAAHQRKRIVLDAEEIDLFIWDTGGQEQFQSLTPLYARASVVAILVASIAEPQSLQNLDRWISLLGYANSELPPVVLAVNKIDLREFASLTVEQIQQEYSNKFSGLFFVSAATNEEVDNLFMFAAQAGYQFLLANRPQTPQSALNEHTTNNNCRC
jgi:small GTP-binding protein